MIEVKLPELDSNLKAALFTESEKVAQDQDSIRRRLRECVKHNKKDIVQYDYVYFNNNINSWLDEILQPSLQEPATYYLAVFRNITGNPSSLPLHTDEIRTSGINYYLELGGSDVVTNFYTPEKTQYYAKQNTWYIFNAGQQHEIDNVESTRIILGLDFESQPSYEELKRRLS